VYPETVDHGDPAFTLGRALEEEGRFDDAITEYKRFFFFHDAKGERDSALVAIALCYASLEKWDEAFQSLDESFAYCSEGRDTEERQLLIAQFEIASKNYSSAEFALLELLYFAEDGTVKKHAAFYLGVANVYGYQWDRAKQYFDLAFEGDDPIDTKKRELIDTMLSAGLKDRLKSKDTAIILSAVIPGLGQMYAGKQADGAVSFLLNSAIAVWLGFLIASGDWADSIMVADYVFLRFYTGNLTNAGIYAEEYNDAVRLELARKITDVLQLEE
jgi:TM2 domain-containing membrane protein YozV